MADLDTRLMAMLYAWRSPAFDQLFMLVTWAGSMWLLAPAAVLIGLAQSRRMPWPRAWFVGLSLAGTWALAHALKLLVARSRPSQFEPLVSMPLDLSFPSAHTMQATAFAMSVLLMAWPAARGWRLPLALAAAAFAAAVGLSRVYLQVHFPSDVIGGALFAMLWVTLAHALLSRSAAAPPARR